MSSPKTIRCLGIELGGGKSARTSIVVLDYFPQEGKIFLVDTASQIQGSREKTGDEELIEKTLSFSPEIIGINAPLSMPPCMGCELECPGFSFCDVPEVKWMRGEAKRMDLWPVKFPTPYTQRPVDVAIRSRVQEYLSVDIPLEETLGSGKAPLLARMLYLKRHLKNEFLEVNPRIAVASLAEWFEIEHRELRRYREIDDGIEYRSRILDKIGNREEKQKVPHLFLYQEDISDLAEDLSLFDALFCGLMSVYSKAGLLDQQIFGFDPKWGTLAFPKKL